MNHTPDDTSAASPPPPLVQRRSRMRLSMVWLVPLLAVAVGLGLAVRGWLQVGPEIVIDFRTAEGLEAGRTQIRFKEVPVGQVTRVQLAPDRQTVRVTAQLGKDAGAMAVADSRFWVVRPRIGAGVVSGLGTLVSGAYIAVDAGSDDAAPQREFTGLEVPPFVLRNEPGRSFALSAPNLGSLDIGSPVYYRRTRVGRVVGWELDPQTDTLSVRLFVESPHERLVTTRSRFWNASGVDLTLNASGLTVNTQSIASVLVGGVAFSNPERRDEQGPPDPAEPAAEGTRFRLYRDRDSANAPPDGPSQRVRMVFTQNARGLAVGAPVEVLGVQVGQVQSVQLRQDPKTRQFRIETEAEIFPLRIGLIDAANPDPRLAIKRLVDDGLRAEMRTGNLLTGQVYVALDYPQRPPPARFDIRVPVPELPTVAGAFSELQPQIMQIVRRLGEVRFDLIGADLQSALKTTDGALKALTPEARDALAGLRRALGTADDVMRQLGPDAQATLGSVRSTLQSAQGTLQGLDSQLGNGSGGGLAATLEELQRTARALRQLADFLQRHPESLLRGAPADPALKAAAEENRR